MTREERLELLKQIEKDIYVPSIESTLLDDAKSCAIHSAIEELEQEPVLDKLRAEIDKIYEREGNSVDCLNALAELKEFIDKYKSESEDK